MIMVKKQYTFPYVEVTNLSALGILMKIGDGNSPGPSDLPPAMGNAPRRSEVF